MRGLAVGEIVEEGVSGSIPVVDRCENPRPIRATAAILARLKRLHMWTGRIY